MAGLRVHLSGSAASDCETDLLQAAQRFVTALTEKLIEAGSGLVLGVGDEPLSDGGEPTLFDWTALEAIASAPTPAPGWPALRPERFIVVASQRALEKIPTSRDATWQRVRSRVDFDLELAPRGWRMAGVVRERQVRAGDILLALGGGAGVEHLAELYRQDGKPVVPIWADIGAISQDGNGGSSYLHERSLAGEGGFKLRDGAGSATARLTSLRLTASGDVEQLASETVALIDDLRPRRAFYVRLLDTEDPDFDAVEGFFRDVVDPVIVKRSFDPYEVDREKPQAAFINAEIFEVLHRSGLVVADLTGCRPNCTMELGYALARRRRTVISARKGTDLPFDSDHLPTHFWDPAREVTAARASYLEWFDLHGDPPPLVE